MKEKISKFFKYLFIILITFSMTNCAVEEIGNKSKGQDSNGITDAKNWFEKYKSTTQFKPEFNDLNFDWQNSKVENLENN